MGMGIDWGLLLDSATKLVVAGVLACVIGWEREVKHRPAGIRTHMLVAMGATLICIVSARFVPESRVADPARIAAQIVSGIGFLGAGTIMRQGSIVVGLTTAASLWTVAAIGMAVSLGGTFYLIAVAATIVVWVTLIVMRRIERAIGHEFGNDIRIQARVKQEAVTEMLDSIRSAGVVVSSLSMTELDHPKEVLLSLQGQAPRSVAPAEFTRLLAADERIFKVEWETARIRSVRPGLRRRRDQDADA
jgi:putative Mg2+ transporter-C (MgtC) family protein